MSEFLAVARLTDLEEGKGKTVDAKGRLIALFLSEGSVYAIDDACLHMGASLADGRLCGKVVTCPWHGWRFNITDGVWVDSPRSKTRSYPTKVNDGVVYLEIDW